MKSYVKRICAVIVTVTFIIVGVVLTFSTYHKTSFAQEALTQAIRILSIIQYKDEVQHARFVLKTIIEHDNPPDNWSEITGASMKRFGHDAFYFFKVWFIESGTTIQDIQQSYPIYIFESDGKVKFDLRYGRFQPTIQFTISNEGQNVLNADMSFPVNNCLFDADYNHDDEFDMNDVILAKEQRKNNG